MSPTKQGQPRHDQERVLAFLADNDPDCKRIDTHISIVFLGKDRVLKVKRAVRLPFLDFSTLENRKHACEEELAVNSRFAPELYRRIVPITQGDGGFEIGGGGPVREWAVEMARFDENNTFDHLARAGHVAPELAETLAVTIRHSHERAEISRIRRHSRNRNPSGRLRNRTDRLAHHRRLGLARADIGTKQTHSDAGIGRTVRRQCCIT